VDHSGEVWIIDDTENVKKFDRFLGKWIWVGKINGKSIVMGNKGQVYVTSYPSKDRTYTVYLLEHGQWTALEDKGASSVAVRNERLYITSHTGRSQEWKVERKATRSEILAEVKSCEQAKINKKIKECEPYMTVKD
jgi:hypothetical protein